MEDLKTEYMKTARDVMLHSDMIPGLIGKKGSGIRALESQFSVKISTDKFVVGLVHLRGEPEALETAGTFLLSMKEEYESKFREFEFDPDATSIIIGKSGTTIRGLQDDHGVRIDIDSNVPGIARLRSDEPESLDLCVLAMKELLKEAGYGDDIVVEEMKVFRNHVGAIVGEGGSVVRTLESDTKAQIRITKNDEDGVVTLRGTVEAVASARKIIEEICKKQEDEYTARKQAAETERAEKQAERQQQQQQQQNKRAEESGEEETKAAAVVEAPRFIPGMSAAWNEENQKGHSMSAQAQKNRQKRERRKAAGRTSSGGGRGGHGVHGGSGSKAAAKVEHYQQDLEMLLGMGMGMPMSAPVAAVRSDPSAWNPPPARSVGRTSSPPPGFGGVSTRRAPPPGFSPVPKNAARKQVLTANDEEVNAAMSKLADLGFSSISGGGGGGGNADFGVIGGRGGSNAVGNQQQPAKKYVSARGGYKLRL